MYKCKYDNCKSRRNIEEGFCKKHLLIHYTKLYEKNDNKICANFKNGCKNAIPLYNPNKKCQKCISIDIENKQNKIRKKRPNKITDKSEIIKFCEQHNFDNINNDEIIFCNKCFNGFPKPFYMVNDEEKIYCMICRDRFIRK